MFIYTVQDLLMSDINIHTTSTYILDNFIGHPSIEEYLNSLVEQLHNYIYFLYRQSFRTLTIDIVMTNLKSIIIHIIFTVYLRGINRRRY